MGAVVILAQEDVLIRVSLGAIIRVAEIVQDTVKEPVMKTVVLVANMVAQEPVRDGVAMDATEVVKVLVQVTARMTA